MTVSDKKAPGILHAVYRPAARGAVALWAVARRGRLPAGDCLRRCAIGVAVAVTSCGLLAAAEAFQGQGRVHTGMCDASAGVASAGDPNLFFVANDEDQGDVRIRLYSLTAPDGSGPLKTSPISVQFLGLTKKHQEVDVEGSARVGGIIYWIGSHSASKDGEPRPNRRRLFATQEDPADPGTLRPVEAPYKGLIDDLEEDARYQPFHLAKAGEKAPKDEGALNIEGLAEAPDGGLLIGFRNPIPKKQALIVPLKNPTEVTRGQHGKFGDPILLDLDGLGIRSIERTPGGFYLIVAGKHDAGGPSRLFRWSGSATTGGQPIVDQDFNPEALFLSDGRVVVLSDDGTRTIPGHTGECKDLEKDDQKRFRSVVIPAP
jgi:hypothetical protein